MSTNRAILIVDDEAIILVALRQSLRAALGSSFRYEIAMNAAEALAVINDLSSRGVRVELVISDWLMPGMKGDEFIMKVRESDPAVRTILVSGQTDENHLEKLKSSGALDLFMNKPWDDKTFAVSCRRLLGEV